VATRPKQADFPMTGKGVEAPKFKDVDRLADKLTELRDDRATLSTQIGDTERRLMEAMKGHELTTYFYSDRKVEYKEGVAHVKIKTVKADSKGSDNGSDSEDVPT